MADLKPGDSGEDSGGPGGRAMRPEADGERKHVTVLFADVAGFTALSDDMDPEEVSDLIGPAVDTMAEEIRRYGGTVAQFMGDGVMALFGAPVAHEDSAIRAVHAALSIQERLSRYSRELTDRGIAFEVRIGLNSGLVVTGSVGDEAAMTYTALGDTVNLASRMETAAQPGTVQLSESTYRLARGSFDFEDLGEIVVKGKAKPVRTYRALAARPGRSGSGAFLRTGFTEFTGRSAELARVEGYLDEALGGCGLAFAITGEPGIGKSRLVRELKMSRAVGPYRCLEGSCLYYGDSTAYLPLLQVLRGCFGIREGEEDGAATGKLEEGIESLGLDPGTVLAPLEDVLSMPVDDEAYLLLEAPWRRERVFAAIGEVLLAESRRQPLLLVIEDLHWIDSTSEEFLSAFSGRLAGERVLLLLVHRPEYAPAWAADLETVRLDRLPDPAGSELVASLLPGSPVSEELAGFIVSTAGGNPLFIEELTRSLLESGDVILDEGLYVLSGERAVLEVPDTVQGIIASRIDRLDDDARRSLQVAAVIGREFTSDLLFGVAPVGGEDEAGEILSRLKAGEFIFVRSRVPREEYAFKHALTREVAYGSLLLKKRKEVHGRIADVIEELHPDRAVEFCEVLAYHCAMSAKPERAIDYLVLAGDKAARALSNREAVTFYEEALGLLGDANPGKRLDVLLALQDPLSLLYYPEGSAGLLEEAEELATAVGDEGSLADIYRKASRYYVVTNDKARALEYSEKSLELARRTDDVDTMGRVAFDVCNARYVAGDLAGVSEICGGVIRLLEERHRETDTYFSSDWTAYSALSGYLGLALGGLGEFDGALTALDRGLEVARRCGDTLGEGWVEYCRLTLYFHKGEAGDLIESSRAAITRFEEMGTEFVLGSCWSYLACGRYFNGEFDEAVRCAERGVEKGRATGLPTNLPLCFVALSLARSGAGDHEGAVAAAGEALALSSEQGSRQFEAYALFALGAAMGRADPASLDAAISRVERGLEITNEQDRRPSVCHGLVFLGELLAIAGRTEDARASLAQAVDLGAAMDMGYWLDRARRSLEPLAT